jgi:hypothetical protein
MIHTTHHPADTIDNRRSFDSVTRKKVPDPQFPNRRSVKNSVDRRCRYFDTIPIMGLVQQGN